MNLKVRRVVGTAGHIDHGKTALVRAITGVDCDRLPEEKRRGITIDLGFADWQTEDEQIGFVDVPGHERFVKNMLAGVGGVDCALLVVAADESVKPQTREHLAICQLLQVPTGLVAITKTDLVESEILEIVRMEIEELLSPGRFAGVPIIPVSSVTGEGLEALKTAILAAVRSSPERDRTNRVFRLPIDRAFTMKGFGSVVTGTALSGTLEADADVELLPGGHRSRARNIQVHGTARSHALAGERVSINLADLPLGQIRRGNQVVRPGSLLPSQIVTAALELLPDAKPLEDQSRVRFHLYSAELLGSMRIVDHHTSPLRHGDRAYVQFRLESPVVAVAGDRFVIRRYSPSITIGGGVVIDPHLPKMRHGTRTEVFEDLDGTTIARRLTRLASLAGLGGVSLTSLELRTGLTRDALVNGLGDLPPELIAITDSGSRRWIHREALIRFRHDAMEFLTTWLRENRVSLGVPKGTFLQKLMPRVDPVVAGFLLEDLIQEKIITLSGDLIDAPGRSRELGGSEGELSRLLEKRFAEAGLSPPPMNILIQTIHQKTKVIEGVIGYLAKTDRLVRLADGLWIHADVFREAREQLVPHRGKTVDIGWFKDLFGITRKVVIPLLEAFDRKGVTKRQGDQRVIL